MPLRRSFIATSGLAALVLTLVAAAPACLLDSSAFLTGGGTTGGGGSAGADTTGLGGEPTSTGSGGTTGTDPTGSEGGTGGSGGSVPVSGDACPGVMISLNAYGKVLVGGDSTGAKDDYGTAVCGGGMSPDLVYAVNVEANGYLEVDLEVDAPYNGFVYVRSDCEIDPALGCSDVGFRVPVEKDRTYYVIVDGHTPEPSGSFKLGLFLDGCGNGIIDGKEECDDSNTADNDTCTKCKVRCTTDGAVDGGSDTYLDPVTHHCYLQSYPNTSWDQARQNCVTWGGTLAALSTQAELGALDGLLDKNFEHCWLGGTDKDLEGTFSWINGELWTFTDGAGPWASGSEPNGGTNENCVEIFNDGRINDVGCNDKLNYMCERAPAGQVR